MGLNIVCTSKPCDGLLYYSYEYCRYLNSIGVQADLIVVTHPQFSIEDYFNSITQKYSVFENVIFNDMAQESPTLIMGRSMLTLAYLGRKSYTIEQLLLLHLVFREKVIAVYSENHDEEYKAAVDYFVPDEVVDLCDYDVYPNGTGKHFEKRIYFDIYKSLVKNIQFEHLFLGTNRQYYEAAEKVLHKYPSHGVLVYDIGVIDVQYNNLIVPVDNVLGIFEKFVYTKTKNDPAPRFIQECKHYNKPIIFEGINRGAEVYYNRPIQTPDVENILNEL